MKISHLGRRDFWAIRADVAQWYDGGDYSANTSMKHVVLDASCLRWEAIEAIVNMSKTNYSDDLIHSLDLSPIDSKRQKK